ncbi:MAG: hypothetical protein M1120_00830 [Patescibacteria group bacterium]|nr:hypothetical protein [Patescibacteria group bacterium]
MSLRKTILATGEYYHIYNRSVQKLPIFNGKLECNQFLESVGYYSQSNPPVKFSAYRKNRERYPIVLENKIVTVVNYCLIPNHFHFTLCQNTEGGIKEFISKISNSYAHYFNIKNKNIGPVFENNFQAVHIETNEQLIHLSVYIHLNPVTSFLVEKPEDYLYSSYRSYIGLETSKIINPSVVLDQYSSIEDYKKLVMEQKEDQRMRDKIKHPVLE